MLLSGSCQAPRLSAVQGGEAELSPLVLANDAGLGSCDTSAIPFFPVLDMILRYLALSIILCYLTDRSS